GTLSPVEALPCGSRSITTTRLPCRARATARLTVVVVLPTPPFWFATQMIRGRIGRGMVTAPLGLSICTARIAYVALGGSSSPPAGTDNPSGPGVMDWNPSSCVATVSATPPGDGAGTPGTGAVPRAVADVSRETMPGASLPP